MTTRLPAGYRHARWTTLLASAAALALGLSLVVGHQPPAVAQDDAPAVTLPEGHYAPFREGIRLNGVTTDGERLRGVITSFTDDEVYYTDAQGQAQSVAWEAFEARFVSWLYTRLIATDDFEGRFRLVEKLAGMDDGQEHALELLRRIERMDPEQADRVAQAREAVDRGVAQAPGNDTGSGEGADPAGDPDAEGGDEDDARRNPRAWAERTEELDAAAIERLDAFVKEKLDDAGMELGNTQTERFLVYTDLPRDEARFWVSVLDRMYVRLCEVFDLDPEVNIWQGKCVLVMFNRQEDYLRYIAQTFGTNATGSAGICFQMGNGDVHIMMFRSNNRDDLAHTLVHEAAHGFLFRYQSSYHVPNWLNEGLAEYLAESLLNNGGSENRVDRARRFVQARGRLDNFLTARNIIGEHYGLAYDVTKLMIDENRRGYVAMIQGIKEGMTAEESFNEYYGASIERVMEYYARTRLRMDDLRLD